MKFFFFVAFVCILFSCGKPSIVPAETIVTDLTITNTNTPASVAQNQNIVSSISMAGPDQCYRFSHMQIAQQNAFLFEIRAKATVPNPDRGTVICQQTPYTKDTTISIPTHLTGKYVLRFYNASQLFKVDTVLAQ